MHGRCVEAVALRLTIAIGYQRRRALHVALHRPGCVGDAWAPAPGCLLLRPLCGLGVTFLNAFKKQ